MKERWSEWRKWVKFHDYIFLTRKLGFDDVSAIANASAIRGFFFWLVWHGRWPE